MVCCVLLQSRRSFQEGTASAADSLPALEYSTWSDSSPHKDWTHSQGAGSQQTQQLTDELETMMARLSAVTAAGGHVGMPAISAAIPVPVPTFTDLPLISQGPSAGHLEPLEALSGSVPQPEDDGHSDASWTDVEDLE